MFGLVNKAIEGLIVSQFGPQIWSQILRRAGQPLCPYVAMQPYGDDVTYKLIDTASQTVGQSPEAVLEAFGEYWVSFTAKEGYEHFLQHCGTSLKEFLLNIDSLHSRVGMIFPEFHPPGFDSRELEDGSIYLEYYSEREGLAPMLRGLLKGLADRYKTAVSIRELVPSQSQTFRAAFVIEFVG